MKMKSIIALLLALYLFAGCHKEGKGGKASISGTVKHHNTIIPNCVVYIKYGATDLPGTTPSAYDDQVVADGNAHYAFNDLYKGDYYVYGIGYDNTIAEEVRGGTHINLKKNQEYTLDVPVTE